jgi:hypothetical protein
MKTGNALVAAGSVLLSAHAIDAHHSVAMFNTDTPVTIKGTLRRAEMANPHSYLFLEQQTPEGRIEWAVEGPAPNQLERKGIDSNAFAAGDVFEACGYVLRDDASGRYAGQRVLVAEVLMLPDGELRIWSPYGQTLCRDQDAYAEAW